ARKRVVLLKAGRTTAGGRTAASHTAALAGRRAVWEAAVRQAGALAVGTVEELIDMLIAFSYIRPGRGRNVGVVGGGGGRSVLAADQCEEAGLATPPLPTEIESVIAERAPDLAGWITNPVDQSILAGSGIGGAEVLSLMAKSDAFDALIANVGEPWALGRPNAEPLVRRVTERFVEIGTRSPKPFAVVLGPADYSVEWQWRLVTEAREKLVNARLAVFPSMERAIRSLATFLACWRDRGK
ncbi:MAG: hypothetical protein HYS09_04020, partial [Chloroflexi bacterium]|nr:hypothetical protein [Chloroflexota bacterium]